MAEPGTYSVSMYKRIDGVLTDLNQKQSFEVERIRKNTLTNPLASEHKEYYKSIAALTKKVRTYEHKFDKASKRVEAYLKNLGYIADERMALTEKVYELRTTMNELKEKLEEVHLKQKLVKKTMFRSTADFTMLGADGIPIHMVRQSCTWKALRWPMNCTKELSPK